jgi:uncharacterized membrane protein YccF (DUF307 family)
MRTSPSAPLAFAVLLLCSLSALSTVIHESDVSANLISTTLHSKDHDQVRNGYMIWVNVLQINNVQASNNVSIQFFQQNEKVYASNVTGNGPFDFAFSRGLTQLGLSDSAKDVNSSGQVFGFYLCFAESTSNVTFNLTEAIAAHFPNTTDSDPFKLWPTQVENFSVVVGDIEAVLSVKYEGVLDVFGADVHWPLWKVFVVFFSAKFGVCFFLAWFDWCCQPLQRVTSWGKFKIFIGNVLWLFFGGLFTGLGYYLAGIILMLTCILAPFGLKLVRIGVFTLFPFGREIKHDEDVHRHEVCSFLGNVLWLILIGFPLVVIHFVLGVVLCILLITIPFGLQHFKLAKIAFMPFGHSVVFREDLSGHDAWESAPLNRNEQQQPRYV